MVKLSENDLIEINKLTGREYGIAKLNKNSTRKMAVANQRKAENENLSLLLSKILLFVTWPQVLKRMLSVRSSIYCFLEFYSIY